MVVAVKFISYICEIEIKTIMNLRNVFDFWDQYLSDWDKDPAKKAGLEKKACRYFTHTSALNAAINYLPEPYYGNTGEMGSPISCIIVDLNPGLSSPFDNFKQYRQPGAFLYDEFHESSYRAFNQKYSPFLTSSIASIGTPMEIPGAAWWKTKRMKWIDIFLKRYRNVRWPFKIMGYPLVFELCPWHSHDWDSRIIHGMSPFLMDMVFDPAAEGIKKSVLPFGFCFGKDTGNELLNNGFSSVKEWSNEHPAGEWPFNKKGKPVNRTYRLLKNEEDVHFLNLYAMGTFNAPGNDFVMNVEPEIIKELHSYFNK